MNDSLLVAVVLIPNRPFEDRRRRVEPEKCKEYFRTAVVSAAEKTGLELHRNRIRISVIPAFQSEANGCQLFVQIDWRLYADLSRTSETRRTSMRESMRANLDKEIWDTVIHNPKYRLVPMELILLGNIHPLFENLTEHLPIML